ncbi:MAG TPA: LysM peptidoglycan-binding domain-containing protein [Polyangiales bacterium]|nr:LysM peptidoglycan-binding domain-containing protein [Polyangiales bacterium]
MLKRSLPAAVLVACWGTSAYAEPGPPLSIEARQVAAAQAVEGDNVDVEEVLRSARRDLLALLAKDSAAPAEPDVLAPPQPDILMGSPPPSMSSAVSPSKLTGTGPAPELTWLRDLVMPDIPIRWDDRLLKALEYYRSDTRGRALVRGLFARQGAYANMIREKLRAAKLPEDLLYVAMVESGFDTQARSAVGATGLWQLMPAPATQYGVEMSSWVDGRMDPERCTDAAVRFFQDEYAELGSWPLSLSAFNMGHGALLRAIRKYNSNDYWLLASLEAGLPYETISYVTRVMAYAVIGRNPKRFGVDDVVPVAPAETVSIELPGGLSLAKIARAAGIEVPALAALNPELKKPRLPPDAKLWPVRFPKERAARFREKWASHGPLLPPHRQHILRLGERVSDVAELYSTTAAKLLKLNDLPDGSEPRAGDKLIVPDVDPIEKPLTVEPTVVGVPAETFVYVDRQRVFYRVVQNDNLDEIARFFHVTADEVRRWNRVAADAKLQRGMFLQLYVPRGSELSQTLVLAPNQVRTLVVGSEEFFNFHEGQQNRVRMRYKVKPGDTLRSLSERFDLSIGSIARINQFDREKKLVADSEIIIYVADPNSRATAAN